jgi:PAS domain S-box-containing protein
MANSIALENLPGFDNKEILQILIEQAPTPVGLYVGREMRIALVNNFILKTWGKDLSVVGKTFTEALPELKDSPFPQLLDEVFTSGISYSTKAAKVPLEIDGTLQTFYFDFTYTPLKKDGEVWGILNTAADVTELVLAKHRVAEAEERLNFALDSAGAGTWDLDVVNNIVIWDDRCKELYGFAPGDKVPYDEVLSYMHPDDRANVAAAVSKALDPGGDSIYDIVFRTIGSKDKKLRWLHCKGRAYRSNGVVQRFSGIALDISEEMAASNEQQKLLSLIENSSDYMALADVNGKKTYLNKAGRRLVGLDENEDISLHSANDFYAPNEENRKLLPATFIESSVHHTVFLRHIKTGEIIPCQADYVRIDDPISGKPVGRGSTVRDLRPELEAQKALADSEDLFRRITTASPTALWITDKVGNITYTNQIWLDWTGAPLEKQLGDGWLNFILPEDRQAASEKFTADFLNQRFHESTFRIKHINGQERWIVCTGNPQFDAAGNFLNFIGSCVDITEQKQLQRQKDDFIGVASHELRTPVTSIKAYAQVLEAMFKKSGDFKTAGMLQKMDSQLNRLTSLIGDLLDVTKINTGRLQLNHTRFVFNDMIDEVVDDLQRTTNRHTIEKHFSETGNVVADRDRLMQVVTNLITNAIKYSPHTEKIILHTAINDKSEIEVCVQDFGIGISEDKKGRVFEQFYRVSGDMQHTFPGLGLGLYISSEIIKREGGRIWVNSEEGKGSTFCFSIPSKLEEPFE